MICGASSPQQHASHMSQAQLRCSASKLLNMPASQGPTVVRIRCVISYRALGQLTEEKRR